MWRDQRGASGAQTALLALLALGLLIIVIRIILGGSLTAADNAKQELEQHGPAISWGNTDGTIPSAPASPPGNGKGPPGSGNKDDGGFFGSVGNFFGQVGGFFKGFGLQAWDDVKGLGSLVSTGWHFSVVGMIVDPDGTRAEASKWVNLAKNVTEHPDVFFQGLVKPFTDPWSRGDYGEAIGRGTFEVALAVVLAVGTGGTGDAALAADGTEEALNAADKAAEVGNAVDKTEQGTSVVREAEKQATKAGTEEQVANLLDEERKNLIADSNPKFPLSDDNARTALSGPQGTTPQVAGPGGEGADIKFVDKDGNVVWKREVKSIEGNANSFNSQLSKAAKQLDYNGEVFVQVPAGTNVSDLLKSFAGRRTAADLDKYSQVSLRIVDESGNLLYQGGVKP